jgi:hypothetical protein
MTILDAVVNLREDLAFDPGETRVGSRTLDVVLGDEAIAKHDANVLQGSACVILLGHPIDRGFFHFFAINEIDDEDFFMARDAMRVNSERFPTILKFSYHMVRRTLCC